MDAEDEFECDDFDKTLKVIVVGNGNVGKTSMTTRYAKGRYTGNYKKTIGVDFMEKRLELRDLGETVNLMIWDTAGQEEFGALTSRYYKGAGAVIYVFSTTDRASFDDLPKWQRKVQDECGRIAHVLVQNKMDLVDDAAMSRWEVDAMADDMGVRLFRSCVQDNVNVHEVFEHVCRQYLKYTSHGGRGGDRRDDAVADISTLSEAAAAASLKGSQPSPSYERRSRGHSESSSTVSADGHERHGSSSSPTSMQRQRGREGWERDGERAFKERSRAKRREEDVEEEDDEDEDEDEEVHRRGKGSSGSRGREDRPRGWHREDRARGEGTCDRPRDRDRERDGGRTKEQDRGRDRDRDRDREHSDTVRHRERDRARDREDRSYRNAREGTRGRERDDRAHRREDDRESTRGQPVSKDRGRRGQGRSDSDRDPTDEAEAEAEADAPSGRAKKKLTDETREETRVKGSDPRKDASRGSPAKEGSVRECEADAGSAPSRSPTVTKEGSVKRESRQSSRSMRESDHASATKDKKSVGEKAPSVESKRPPVDRATLRAQLREGQDDSEDEEGDKRGGGQTSTTASESSRIQPSKRRTNGKKTNPILSKMSKLVYG